MRTLKLVAALSVAGAMSLGSYAPVQAAPMTPLSAAAKPTSLDGGSAIKVRWGGWGWRGGGWGWGIGALAAGAVIGAAIASPFTYGGYYPYYGYGYPYSGYGYGYAPAYYPSYSYGYYRPIRRFHVVHYPYWRHSFGMYRVRHYRRW